VQLLPGLAEFVARLQQPYDVFFFTASHPDYANQIINAIAPSVRPSCWYFKDSCQTEGGYLVKDLAVLRRPLAQTLVIDDVEGSALANPMNLVRVTPLAGDMSDNILIGQLLPLLEHAVIGADLPARVRNMLVREQSASLGGVCQSTVNRYVNKCPVLIFEYNSKH
jgi:hypothetical protein